MIILYPISAALAERDGVLSDRELSTLTASRVHYYSNAQGEGKNLIATSSLTVLAILSRRVLDEGVEYVGGR